MEWRFQSFGLWSSRYEYLPYNSFVLKMGAAASASTLIRVYQNTWTLFSDRIIFIVIDVVTSNLGKHEAL
jgi:hypothetical protein